MFDPPVGVTLPSICPGLAHPVSGLPASTTRPIKTRFLYGSPRKVNLANTDNSLTHYTKGTQSHPKMLPLLVRTRFQVLFHSPSGVLFAFPSRYWFTIGRQVVFSLGGWSPHLQTGYHVSRPTHAHHEGPVVYGSITLYAVPSQRLPLEPSQLLGSSPFARRYLGNLI